LSWSELSWGQVGVLSSIAAVVAVLMEPWSRWVHATLWHGVLMPVHRTHHRPAGEPAPWLEANDVFSVLHAAGATAVFAVGAFALRGWAAAVVLGVACGVTAYGVAYMVVHDGLVHRRLPLGFLDRSRWLRRIRAAHEVHHRDGGPPYGLFAGPRELRAGRPEERRRRWRTED